MFTASGNIYIYHEKKYIKSRQVEFEETNSAISIAINSHKEASSGIKEGGECSEGEKTNSIT